MTWRPPALRTGHPYHMHDAIWSQPGALRLVAVRLGLSPDGPLQVDTRHAATWRVDED